jgi:hypothetical protein
MSLCSTGGSLSDSVTEKRLVSYCVARFVAAIFITCHVDVEHKASLIHETCKHLSARCFEGLGHLHAMTLAPSRPTLSTRAKSFASTLTVAQWSSPSAFILVLGWSLIP